MRTSRVAKETARLFDSTPSAVPLRRSTRTALARFSYNNNNATSSTSAASSVKADEDIDEEVTFGTDIEDAVKTERTTTTTRKRKRTTAATSSSTPTTITPDSIATSSTLRRTSSRIRTENIKPEPVEDEEVKPTPRTSSRAKPSSSRTATVKREASSPSPSSSLPETKPKVSRKQPARTTANGTILPPTNWEEIYSLVKEMRLNGPAKNAAVDTMGCERLALPTATAKDRRFHTLVALMLSSQTKDTVNAEAMKRLHRELPPYEEGQPPGLNLQNMIACPADKLNELIGKVGFHNNKTKYLQQTAVILRDKFGGDIPPTIEGLTSLPGVGPKMAHLCMSAENGWNRVEGIGVDVHVHRITNLWGWQNPPSKSPEETRMALQSWLPKEKWKEINWLLVGLGQSVCLPQGRKCGDCEVGLKGLCKSADRGKVNEGRRRRERMGVEAKVEEEDIEMTIKEEKKEESVGADEGLVAVKKEEGVEEEDEVGDVEMVKVEEAPGAPVLTPKEEETVAIKTERTSLGVSPMVIKKEGDSADQDLEMIEARDDQSQVKKEEPYDEDIEMADVEVKPDDVVKEEQEAFTDANIKVRQVLMKQEEQDTVMPSTEPKIEREDTVGRQIRVKNEQQQQNAINANGNGSTSAVDGSTNDDDVKIKKEESAAAVNMGDVKVKTADDAEEKEEEGKEKKRIKQEE
ncbi:putative endonuclease III [Cladorrhinum sp. PSN259]|nr:putative endonuclease III [Cladorrhinum sp. PSN259]